jgi:manganese/iron transport system permease protein
MIDLIVAPLRYPFMVRGLAAAVMVGLVCAVLGCYVVLRGMAFLGDALAHSILPGIAIAYLRRGSLFVGALVAGVLIALGIGYLSRQKQLKEDTAIGIVFAGAFALGIAILSSIRSYTVDLTHILFGNILGVSTADLYLTAGLGLLVLLVVLALYKELLVLLFDPVLAAVLRLPSGFLHYLLLILTAVTIVVALQTVGVALVMALLVTPAATAYLLTHRLPVMMALAALCGIFSAVTGLYLSFYMNIASGSAVVLACTALFVLALFLSPRRGLVWTWWRQIAGTDNLPKPAQKSGWMG